MSKHHPISVVYGEILSVTASYKCSLILGSLRINIKKNLLFINNMIFTAFVNSHWKNRESPYIRAYTLSVFVRGLFNDPASTCDHADPNYRLICG
jgi:hypothetical protein